MSRRKNWNEWVEDSTKGYAKTDPKRYKGDSLIQAWLERRRIASLTEWLIAQGNDMRFMSDVLRALIDIMYDLLLAQGKIREFSIQQATDYLQFKFRLDLNPGGRGLRNLDHNLILENKQLEAMNKYREPATVKMCEISPNDPLVQIAKETARKISERQKIEDSDDPFGYDKISKESLEEIKEARKRQLERIHPMFRREDGQGIDWDKVREAKARGQAEYDERRRKEELMEKLREKSERERAREEIREARGAKRLEEKKEKLRRKLKELEEGKKNSQLNDLTDYAKHRRDEGIARKKSEEELEADAKRLKDKDAALFAALDTPAPRPDEEPFALKDPTFEFLK